VEAALAPLQRASATAMDRFKGAFVESLREARDLTGRALARCAQTLHPDDLSFEAVAARFMDGFERAGNRAALEENFRWRGIDARRATMGGGRRGGSACAACRDPFAVLGAGSLLQHPHRDAMVCAAG
jgi:hypothetical protein